MGSNNNDKNVRQLHSVNSDRIYILHTSLVYTCAPKRVWTTVRTERIATYGQPSVLERVRTAVRTRALADEIFVVRPCFSFCKLKLASRLLASVIFRCR